MRTLATVILSALCFLACAAAEKDTKAEVLFNGKDLSGWTGDPRIWSVKDGAIVGSTVGLEPLRANTFLVWTNGEAGNFDFVCQYRITPSASNTFGNSGIQYRSKLLDAATWAVGGYQADIEAGPSYTGILYEERMTRGIMAERGQKVEWTSSCEKKVTGSVGDKAELQKAIRPGDWNEYRIIANGNHLQHFVNGRQTIDVTDNCASKAATNGVIALQMHVGTPFTTEFKELRLKRLAPKAPYRLTIVGD